METRVITTFKSQIVSVWPITMMMAVGLAGLYAIMNPEILLSIRDLWRWLADGMTLMSFCGWTDPLPVD